MPSSKDFIQSLPDNGSSCGCYVPFGSPSNYPEKAVKLPATSESEVARISRAWDIGKKCSQSDD
jgi:hypothetical protein